MGVIASDVFIRGWLTIYKVGVAVAAGVVVSKIIDNTSTALLSLVISLGSAKCDICQMLCIKLLQIC